MSQRPKALVLTYGCQMNVYDSAALRALLWRLGFDEAPSDEEADLTILNTCCVRKKAEEKAYGRIQKLGYHARNRGRAMVIGVMGCMAVALVDEINRRAPKVAFVLKPQSDEVLGEILRSRFPDLRPRGEEASGLVESATSETLPFKKFLPIMRGCNNFCTYCIVPHTRGRERSRSPEAIEAEMADLEGRGVVSVTLLGQNVNSYDAGSLDFPALLDRLATRHPTMRIRYMTSHPKDLSDELIEVMAGHANLCKHLHLPLQAGSDSVLKRMNRKYDSAHYLGRVKALREVLPDLSLTTDLICGFPGETPEDFEATLDMVRRIRYDAAFTFHYSPRSGTAAAGYPAQVPPEERMDRLRRLIDVQREISLEVNRRHLGEEAATLVERPARHGRQLVGRTDGNKVLLFDGEKEWVGSFRRVRITNTDTFTLYGEDRGPCDLQGRPLT